MKTIYSALMICSLLLFVSAEPQSVVEFYDSTGAEVLAKFGWEGGRSGRFFIDSKDGRLLVLHNGALQLTNAAVTAASFSGDGSGLTNLKKDSLLSAKVDGLGKAVDSLVAKTQTGGLTPAELNRIIDTLVNRGVMMEIDSIDWGRLRNIPAGFRDGIDNAGGSGSSAISDIPGLADSLTAKAPKIHTHAVTWSELGGIPAGFSDGVDNVGTAASEGEISGLQDSLNARALGSHAHSLTFASIPGLADSLGVKASVTHTHGWAGLSGIPAGFSDGIDNVGATTIAGITGLVDSLSVKAPAAHTHALSVASVTGLADSLNARARLSHTQAWSTITGVPAGFADGTDNTGADVVVDATHFVKQNVGGDTAFTSYQSGQGVWKAGLTTSPFWYMVTVGGTELFQLHQSGIMNVYCPSVYFREQYAAALTGVTRDLYIDENGKIGYVASSRRYKENIRPIGDDFSARIYSLNPVLFDYKDDGAKNQLGLIAEEVEEVMPELVSYDEEGKPQTVSYSDLIPLLLKEVKNLKKDQDELRREMADLRAGMGRMEKNR